MCDSGILSSPYPVFRACTETSRHVRLSPLPLIYSNARYVWKFSYPEYVRWLGSFPPGSFFSPILVCDSSQPWRLPLCLHPDSLPWVPASPSCPALASDPSYPAPLSAPETFVIEILIHFVSEKKSNKIFLFGLIHFVFTLPLVFGIWSYFWGQIWIRV